MGQRSRWTLPTEINPAARRCFLVSVPDERFHIAAFRGALYELTKAYTWENDDAHSALDVAAVWDTVWSEIEEVDCDMLHQTLIEFDPDCGLRWSYDGGDTWTDASFLQCATDAANAAIQGAIDDGLLQQAGGQPSPSSPPVGGDCLTFHVILHANDSWLCPFPINTDDLITVSELRGGWTDGTLLWYCPNGDSYYLGACVDIELYEPTDPMPDKAHMQLIGGYGDSSPVYFDPLAGTFSIPAGITNQQLWFQANDDPRYDDSGEIEFDVQICAGWSYLHDYQVSQGAIESKTVWYPNEAWGEFGIYTAGQGWQGEYYAGNDNTLLFLKLAASLESTVTHIKMWYYSSYEQQGLNSTVAYYNRDGTTDTQIGASIHLYQGEHIAQWDGTNAVNDAIILHLRATHNQTLIIRRVEIYGVGPNPFA